MLPRSVRLRSSAGFADTVRRGIRVGRPTLVVHVHRMAAETDPPVQVGFVVSKAVGNAVVRNRVKRRLRHLSVQELAVTPAGTWLVVRALPPAASADSLAADLHSAWSRAVNRLVAPQKG